MPKTATDTITLTSRQEYERVRRQSPERQEAHSRAEQKRRQRAKELGLCRHCSAEAIPSQTRCETCAEKHRQARRKNGAVWKEKEKAERELTMRRESEGR